MAAWFKNAQVLFDTDVASSIFDIADISFASDLK